MFGGPAHYRTETGHHYRVDDDGFVMLNHGHGYSVEKSAVRSVETFCVFFPPGLLPEVAGSVTSEGLSVPNANHAFELYEHRRPHQGPISRRVLALRQRYRRGQLSEGMLQEQLVWLASDIVREHRRVERRVERLPWARAATRSELFRRVHVGRDYLHAHLSAPFSLEKTAKTATMSRYHFLRAFREVLGETPLQYVMALRTKRATDLLASSKLSVTEVAFEVGYDSVGAFSAFFSSQTGVSPSAVRRRHRRK